MKKNTVKEVVGVVLVAVVAVVLYMWLSAMRLENNSALLNVILNPCFAAFVCVISAICSKKSSKKKDVQCSQAN